MQIKDQNFLVIGAGISGISLARLLIDNGARKVKIIEKKNHIGGNCFDYVDQNGFCIHKYGPHIFHTSYDEVFQFLNKYSDFNFIKHKVLVDYQNELIPFPINAKSIEMITKNFQYDVLKLLKEEFQNQTTITIKQLLNSKNEEVKQLGELIFKNVYENYTIKMWGISANDVDPSILSRVKINLSDDWNYFPNDKVTAMPKNGWTNMLKNMLNDPRIELILNCDYKTKYPYLDSLSVLTKSKVYAGIFYTGMIDELLDFKYGKLPYRSINFQFEYLKYINNFQPTSVINYPAHKTLTRITEYKKLTLQNQLKGTVIGKEYPGAYNINDPLFNIPCYPINNLNTANLYKKYFEEIKEKIPNFYLVGRLAQYRYFDTDDAIYNAMQTIQEIQK